MADQQKPLDEPAAKPKSDDETGPGNILAGVQPDAATDPDGDERRDD